MTRPYLTDDPDSDGCLLARGDWRLEAMDNGRQVPALPEGNFSRVDATGIEKLDSAGALLLLDCLRSAGVGRNELEVDPTHQALVDTVARAMESDEPDHAPGLGGLTMVLDHVGSATRTMVSNLLQLIGFLGQTLVALATTLVRPGRLRLTSVVHHMEQTGFNALPLVALLSFLVGAVIAFLGATVLRAFGAEVFVVDLTTYAFLREFGVLLTAILLAGRTASAFTAQIGTMKSREEIDAMRTLGLDPVELLVLPRLIALLIMLPVLTVVAMIAGLAGGLVVSVTALDIGAEMYFNRMYEMMELQHYLVGLIKAPIFAFVIALVGCLEGLKVEGTAQSVGERTTSAVVQSITLVIIIDAMAAVFFMEIGW